MHSISRPQKKECISARLVSKFGVVDIRLQTCVKNPLLSIFIPAMTQREVCRHKLMLLLRKHLKGTAVTCLY